MTAGDEHLWIVLSDPAKNSECILLVSVTTWRADKDSSCLIQRGEHPFVTRDSCSYYEDARAVKLAQLYPRKDAGLLKMRAPLSEALLVRVRYGAGVTSNLKMRYVQLLDDQGLTEPTPF